MPSLSSSNGDERILSYHDEILYKSDLSILRSPTSFINDRLISFYFTHLSQTLTLDPSSSSSILLIPPSLSFLFSFIPDPSDLGPILAPRRLPSRSLVLLPVNDNADPTVAEGGSHWSLLVYHRRSNTFVHHDSLRPLNAECARRLYGAVKGFVEQEGARFVEGPTPRQRNGWDCGLFVMAVARAVVEWGKEEEEKGGGAGDWFGKVEEELGKDGGKVGMLRGELLDLITGMINSDGNGGKSCAW